MIQAAAPIFTVILAARMDVTQRVTGPRLIGVGVGFVGVALLVGVQRGGDLVAALGGARRRALLRRLRALRRADGAHDPAAAGVDRPALLRRDDDRAVRPRQLPGSAPPAKVWLAVLALGVLGSGIAYLLYFAIIASAGASRAILVTYLVPAFALAYGAVFLDEAITARRSPASRSCSRARRSRPACPRRVHLASEHDHRYWPLLLTLASLWGASYLFIKVGVDGGFSPGALMAARTLIAGAVLFAYLMATIGTGDRGVAAPRGLAGGDRARVPQRRRPFWLDRLGRAAHRLGQRRGSRRRRCRSSRC